VSYAVRPPDFRALPRCRGFLPSLPATRPITRLSTLSGVSVESGEVHSDDVLLHLILG